MIKVLLISSLSERYYYDAFVRECERIGIKVGILDPEHCAKTRGAINIHMARGVVRGFLDVIRLGDDQNSVVRTPIEDIAVAWYLRVTRERRVRDIPNVAERFQWSETLYALEALLSVLPCTWVNTFEAIDRLTCNKLLQQMRAERAGLQVPRTIISNAPEQVMNFSQAESSRLLLKSIGYVSLDPNDEFVLYSELFDTAELEQSSAAIQACPVYAQEYIPKKCEYRVMVIGESVLACRIDSQASTKTLIDWRHYDFEHVAHTTAELPIDIQRKLIAFMRSVGLRYGAIDMIETPDGEFVFLEVNPSGQWDWIAKLAHLPISDAVAQMLKSLA